MVDSSPMLPVLLKLVAASLTGALAFLAFRNHLLNEALSALRRDIRARLLRIPEGVAAEAADPQDRRRRRGPPVVLVVGFPAHGKSSLVNTACRALAGECGPFLARADAGPPGPTPGVTTRRVFRVPVADHRPTREEGEKSSSGDEGDGEDDDGAPAVYLVESPDLPEAAKVTAADVETALSAGGCKPECVLLVLRSAGPQRAALRKLPEIASVVRQRGLNLVVALTHKKALRGSKEGEELRKEVAVRVKSDCVYLIENYTASGGGGGAASNPAAFRNNFDTHCNILAIVRQCIEFAALHRTHGASGLRKLIPAELSA